MLFLKEEAPRGLTTVTGGQRLVLECEAGGSPSPTVHWLFNGERVLQVRQKAGLTSLT